MRLDAVTRVVQSWRESGYAAFAWHDGEDAAAYATLGGKPHMPSPSPRPIVETGHSHRGEDIGHVFGFDDLLASDWVYAIVASIAPMRAS